MRGKFIAGALIGAAAGLLFMPEMSRDSKRMIKRTKRAVMDVAGDAFSNIKNQMK